MSVMHTMSVRALALGLLEVVEQVAEPLLDVRGLKILAHRR